MTAPAARASEGILERTCRLLSAVAICIMLAVVGTDVFTRAVFNYSFEIADDVGGYMLVLVTFVSLSVCQVNNSFHHVEFVQARLSPRGRAISRLLFDLLALATSGLLLWQMGRFEVLSFLSGDTAPTRLATPLWVPRTVMVFGVFALCLSLLRTSFMHARRIAAA